MAKLNYAWRLLMTGVAFASFSVGGLLITLCVFPVIRILPGGASARRDRMQRVIHTLFRVFIRLTCAVGIMRLHLKNAEALRSTPGTLVLANHPTLIDVVVMISLMPKADCVVKAALWKSPFLGGVVRAAGYISNDKSPEELVDACADILRRGGALIIFPEGTRSVPGTSLQFQRGAARIALGSGKPILPVVLRCDPPTLGKGNRWHDIPHRRFDFSLEVKSQLHVEDLIDPALPSSVAVRRLTETLKNYFAQEASVSDGQATY